MQRKNIVHFFWLTVANYILFLFKGLTHFDTHKSAKFQRTMCAPNGNFEIFDAKYQFMN
jgi:hypothetical protein